MSTIGEEFSQNVRTRFYIGGEWGRSHSAQWVKVVDPTGAREGQEGLEAFLETKAIFMPVPA